MAYSNFMSKWKEEKRQQLLYFKVGCRTKINDPTVSIFSEIQTFSP